MDRGHGMVMIVMTARLCNILPIMRVKKSSNNNVMPKKGKQKKEKGKVRKERKCTLLGDRAALDVTHRDECSHQELKK